MGAARLRYSASGGTYPLGDYAAKTLGYKRMAIVAEDFTYGHEGAGGFHLAFEAAGGKIVQKLWPHRSIRGRYGVVVDPRRAKELLARERELVERESPRSRAKAPRRATTARNPGTTPRRASTRTSSTPAGSATSRNGWRRSSGPRSDSPAAPTGSRPRAECRSRTSGSRPSRPPS